MGANTAPIGPESVPADAITSVEWSALSRGARPDGGPSGDGPGRPLGLLLVAPPLAIGFVVTVVIGAALVAALGAGLLPPLTTSPARVAAASVSPPAPEAGMASVAAPTGPASSIGRTPAGGAACGTRVPHAAVACIAASST